MRLLICLVCLCFAAGISYAADENKKRPQLTFEIAISPDSELGSNLITAMTTVLDKKGYDFKYIPYPAKRGLQELKAGRLDGSIGRIGDLARLLETPQLHRINYAVATFIYSRWCRPDVKASTTRIRVGSRLGALAMMMLEPHIQGPHIELHEMKDQKAGVQMLKAKRLECILTTEMTLEPEGITSDDLKGMNRFDLITYQVFPWLLEKHKHLIPAIEVGLNAYPFSDSFKKKFQNTHMACNKTLNVLCPDGIIFLKTVDFR